MPKVIIKGKVKTFPYTKEGIEKAKVVSKKSDKKVKYTKAKK